MRILVVGGGSGGHVTPVLAVLAAIKRVRPRTELRFWCDRSFLASTRSLLSDGGFTIPVTPILSGKLRRYHGISIGRQILDIPTTLRNLRDGLFVIAGFFQSFFLLVMWRPDAVFTKGGFVCLPVGLAAHLLRIPLVIHDSDAHPGLTNRVLSRYATRILTGAPVEYYPYERTKTAYVGIPIGSGFTMTGPNAGREAKRTLGLDDSRPLVVVTGGGLGARRLNTAVIAASTRLLPEAGIVHITGTANYEDVVATAPHDEAYIVLPFVSKHMDTYLAAADVVIARAGATTMLELASLHKATILVPNAQLTGDHQTKNALVYADAGAAVVLKEDEIETRPELLADEVVNLLRDADRRSSLERAIGEFAKPDAARDTADAIIDAARNRAR